MKSPSSQLVDAGQLRVQVCLLLFLLSLTAVMRQWSRRIPEWDAEEALLNEYLAAGPPVFGTLYERLMGSVVPGNSVIDDYVDYHYLEQLFTKEGRLMAAPRSRELFGALANHMDLRIGAEVGVFLGAFSSLTLRTWPKCESYTLIDLFTTASAIGFVDTSTAKLEFIGQEERVLANIQAALKPTSKVNVKLMASDSIKAAGTLEDNSLDYLFLDAQHDACTVYLEMVQYWPKVKCKGIFAGHDFLGERDDRGDFWARCLRSADGAVKDRPLLYPGPKQGILKFAREHNQTVLTVQDYFSFEGPSFIIHKWC